MSNTISDITARTAGATLQEALGAACREFSVHRLYNTALPRGQWSYTSYGEFMDMAMRMANAIASEGVGPGGRVVLMADNSPRWTSAYTAILMAGAVAVPVDARLTINEVRNILTDSKAELMLCDSAATRIALEADAPRIMELESIDLRDISPIERIHTGIATEIACLLYTSGTTGSPKGVMLSHQNLLSDAAALFEAGIISASDNVMCVLPLYHTYAFMCGFLAPILIGAQITIPEALKGPAIVSAAIHSGHSGVTIIPAVPQILELFRDRAYGKINAMPGPLSSIMRGAVAFSGLLRRTTGVNLMGAINKPLGKRFRFFTSGGARLEPTVMLDLEAMGFTVLEGYGLTETSPIAAFNREGSSRPGSVGQPIHLAQIRILAKPGSETGEIAIRGPMVSSGYYHRPEENEAAFKDGWFLSGDLGYMDQDGYIFITGRKKEIIVLSSGKNVYPEEVERHYMSCPMLSELCVYGDREGLRAVIVPDYDYMKANGIANASEAIKWEIDMLSKGIAPHKRILGYTLRSQGLPRTPLGKLRRFLVQKEAEAGRRSVVEDDGSMSKTSLNRRVAQVLKKIMPAERPVRASDNLELDLSMDSLRRVELAVALEDEFSISIPEGLMAEVHTAGELAMAMDELLQCASDHDQSPDSTQGEGLDTVLNRPPSENELQSIGFNLSRMDRLASKAGLVALKALCATYFRLKTRGIENLPEPPYIIAPNHSSYLDAFIIGASLPSDLFEQIHFIGMEKFFRSPTSRHMARLAHVIPIDPDASLGKALSLSAHCLRSGSPLVVFPEGGCSMDGNLLPFRPGIGILSLKLNVPVVPTFINGTFRSMPKWSRLPRPVNVTVTFGEPVVPTGAIKRDYGFQAYADMIRERVHALRPE